jgi:uncharacterized protein (TIGR02611 family)
MTAQTPPSREEPKFVRKLRAQREQHRDRSRITRGLFVVAGFTCLLAGLAMLVTPGPAFVVIPIGLAILSLEFTWAERMLDKSLEQADKAAQRASETSPTQRVLAGVATALGVGAVVAWALLGDIPLLPV